ncbi:hypothetical protein [Acrocarpospora macrocephala]|nr:hypothetical protein [Acrocarpospora macrocephala]
MLATNHHAVRGADKAITDAINKQFERGNDDGMRLLTCGVISLPVPSGA